MKTLYLLSLGAQESLITQHCFGDCGKIIVSGIEFMGGSWFPCKQESCPNEEAQEDVTDIANPPDDDRRVIVRKLR